MPLPQPFVDLVMSAEFAAPRMARDFNALAAILNTPTESGPVPAVELRRLAFVQGKLGLMQAKAYTNATAEATKAACFDMLRLLDESDTVNVTANWFGAICDVLITATVLTNGQKAALIALAANRRGRAEVILGRLCTGSDCLEAAGGD